MNVLGEGALSNYDKVISIKEYECKDEYMQQALQQLHVLERTCLLLQIEGEFSVQDIADIVDRSQEEVVAILRKAQEHILHYYHSLIEQEKDVQKLSSEPIKDISNSPSESHIASYSVSQPSVEQIEKVIHGIPTIKPSVPLDALLDFWQEQDQAKVVPDVNMEWKCLSSIPAKPSNYTIVFSYAQRDKEYLDSLKQHLSPLKWQGTISRWYDHEVSARNTWTQDLMSKFDTALFILLLISPDFFTSHPKCDEEMTYALERYKDRKMIIPIIVRDVDWNETFISRDVSCSKMAILETLPTNGKPITCWHNKDEAFVNVVKGIRKVMSEMSLAHIVVPSDYRQQAVAEKQRESETNEEEVHPRSGCSSLIKSTTFSSDGRSLLSSTNDGTVNIWNARGRRETTQHFWDPTSKVSNEFFCWKLSGSDDKTIQIWNNATNGEETCHFFDHNRGVRNVVLSPDKTRFATAGNDHTVRVWDANNGQTLLTYAVHTAELSSVAWSPDGLYLASVGNDHTVRVWDANNGQTLLTYAVHAGVSNVAWSPDGMYLATMGNDRTVQIWSVINKEEIHRFMLSETTKHWDITSGQSKPDFIYIPSKDDLQIPSKLSKEKLVSHNIGQTGIRRSENADLLDTLNEDTWKTLRSTLHPLVLGKIYAAHVPIWNGQEHDLAEDILQEALMRTFTYVCRMKNDVTRSLNSLKSFMNTITINYIRDLSRHDMHLIHESTLHGQIEQWYEMVHDSATEKISYEELFLNTAKAISTFPEKQRDALLADLANRTSFSEKPTPLRKAFLEVGIDLHEYQSPLPLNHLEQARYIALVSHAYERLASLRLDVTPYIHEPYQNRSIVKLQRKDETSEYKESEENSPLFRVIPSTIIA